MKLLRQNSLIQIVFVVTLLSLGVYLFMIMFQSRVSFAMYNYEHNAHHYIADSRIEGGRFDLVNALAQYDAQWYLMIADSWYPKSNLIPSLKDKSAFGALPFAFFPLYPFIIRVINNFIGNVELSAFVSSIVIQIFIGASLYYVVDKIYSRKVAFWTVILLFTFPYSIFLRSYFAEGLFLFFLIWFVYGLHTEKHLLSALSLGLLNVAKGNGVGLVLLFCYILFKERNKKSIIRILGYVLLATLPVLLWVMYQWWYTGDPLLFIRVRSAWNVTDGQYPAFVLTLYSIGNILSFRFFGIHFSQVEILMGFLVGVLLLKSRRVLSANLWSISLLLYLIPLVVNDWISFSRLQTVSFPLFIYLAYSLKTKYLLMLSTVFYFLLLIMAPYFVNWYWFG